MKSRGKLFVLRICLVSIKKDVLKKSQNKCFHLIKSVFFSLSFQRCNFNFRFWRNAMVLLFWYLTMYSKYISTFLYFTMYMKYISRLLYFIYFYIWVGPSARGVIVTARGVIVTVYFACFGPSTRPQNRKILLDFWPLKAEQA